MKTTAVRLYGVNDLRLEKFDLPPIQDDEILVKVISDSICMSSYKAASLGPKHKRVPDDVGQNPIIIGHEFCGVIEEVGKKWRHKFKAGDKFGIQPAINYKGSLESPGYSYPYMGGAATHIILANEVMEMDCLLPYDANAFFYGSLSEPLSCIIGAFHAQYHTKRGSYVHEMGIREGGNAAILAGAGPMGMGAIDYAIHSDRRPRLLVVTDIDDSRLRRAEEIYPVAEAAKCGVKLIYVNTLGGDPVAQLMEFTEGAGYDDVFVFAPVAQVIEQADKILAFDGCLNFFAGPTNPNLSAQMNFYNVHYNGTHVVATSGGNTDDMLESLEMMAKNRLTPAGMVTHIGGLDAVIETTLNLPKIPGGKKLIYTNIRLPLTAIDDFAKLGESDPFFKALSDIVKTTNGLWNEKAEQYLLENAKEI